MTEGRTPSEEHVCVDCPQPCPQCDYCAVEQGRSLSSTTTEGADVDAFRIAEWNALPDTCAISGCDNDEADQRGPVFMRDGSMHKVCPEHWEPIFRVLGEQATWESMDAMRSGV